MIVNESYVFLFLPLGSRIDVFGRNLKAWLVTIRKKNSDNKLVLSHIYWGRRFIYDDKHHIILPDNG